MEAVPKILLYTLILLSISCGETSKVSTKQKPNVIIVITDDQGYGDIAAHGNPYVKTPHLDKLHGESVRFTDFHVSPTCSPSRAALMTGRYTNRTGAWHTIAGWSLLREEEKTLGNMFSEGGYTTGAFGKWHLGDNYPYRVQDRGFHESVVHGGGGVQQTPDYWGNDYFNDTYFHNGLPKKYEGYCTDVFFDEALKFIEQKKDETFFCYISTNAPHWPYNVPTAYEEMYSEYDDSTLLTHQKQFLGMLTNIDDNIGKLRDKLKALEIADNTILIFMTDNGTAAGWVRQDRNDPESKYLGYNANMRGTKNHQYDGGHRVPLFIYWKDGEILGGKDISTLTAHIDMMPTLAELVGINLANGHRPIDGKSLVPLIKGDTVPWSNRILVTDSQREQVPARWRKTAVMKDKWRLVNETELYNIAEDPSQKNDIAASNSEIVEELTLGYDDWYESVSSEFEEEMYIKVGSNEEKISCLTTHDWHAPNSNQKWNQLGIRNGDYGNGYWTVDFVEGGEYEISLSRYPRESGLNFNDSPAAYSNVEEPGMNSDVPKGKVLEFTSAYIKIGDSVSDKVRVDMSSKEVKIKSTVSAGRIKLWTFLEDKNSESCGAYYAYIKRL